MLCWPPCCVWKRSYFVLKSFVPANRAGVFFWENFHPGHWNLGHRASPASHEQIEIFTKKRVERRDLKNRASLVDRAHMNRSFVRTAVLIKYLHSSMVKHGTELEHCFTYYLVFTELFITKLASAVCKWVSKGLVEGNQVITLVLVFLWFEIGWLVLSVGSN